jgi:transposase-like protein
MRPLRQDKVDEIVAAYGEGATVQALAEQFGVYRDTIGRRLARRGVDTRPPGLQPDEVRVAAELYRSGWSLLRLGEKFKVSGNTVRRYLLEAGVELRQRRGWT